MARRATLFTSLRSPEAVFLGGSYELCAPGVVCTHDAQTTRKLNQAFAALSYDALIISKAERELLTAHGHTPSAQWYTLEDDEPLLVTHNLPTGQLAIVFFPENPSPHARATAEAMARSIRASAVHNLIVGVCPWGATMEKEFLDASGDAFDILLGSGDGPSYSGLYLNSNMVVWARAPLKGKGVNVLTIPELPRPGTKIPWQPEISIRGEIRPLPDGIALDPKMSSILDQ